MSGLEDAARLVKVQEELTRHLSAAGFATELVQRVELSTLELAQAESMLAQLRADYPLNASNAAEVFRRDGKPTLMPGQAVRVVVISDCTGDPEADARAAAYESLLPHTVRPEHYAIDGLNKFHLGFVVASALYEALNVGEGRAKVPTVIVGNAAPRSGDNRQAEAPPFVFAELKGDCFYFGTFGAELSRIKDQVQNVWELDLERYGFDPKTPFRSRFLSGVVGHWLKGDLSGITTQVSADLIPAPFEFRLLEAGKMFARVGHIDVMGNIKLSFGMHSGALDGWERGQRLIVEINENRRFITLGDSLGDVSSGDLVLAPGSTLHSRDAAKRIMDIYLNGGRATDQFESRWRRAKPGDEVRIYRDQP